MTDYDRCHMDPSTLVVMFLIILIKYNKGLFWEARTIDMIINRDDVPVTDHKNIVVIIMITYLLVNLVLVLRL